ncbi:MAG: hypothetical protein QXR06_04515 [Candidatus Bathyarchaeia archaeon]|nr:hypothetical protein [Candidatus Bathyarchaeota archaeon]
MKFREFAWNGFYIEVPENMRLTAEGGNLNSGYLRLEMEGFLMEVKWDPLDPKKAKPLAEVAESFLKTAKKTIEKETKKKIDLKAEITEGRFVSSHSAYSMIVKSGVREPIYIWNCNESKRIILVHFTSVLPEKDDIELIGRILESFRCHGKEDLIPWSALNMHFALPPSFLLSDRRMAVGRTYLIFDEQKPSTFTERGRSLVIEFFSMANVLFGDKCKNLEEWFKVDYWKDLKKRCKNISFRAAEISVQKVMRHKVIYRRGVKKSGFFWRRTTVSENFTWYCFKSNRIYSVSFVSYISRPFFLKRAIDEKDDGKVLQGFLSSFKCHF